MTRDLFHPPHTDPTRVRFSNLRRLAPRLPEPPPGGGLGLDNSVPTTPADGKPTNDDEWNGEKVEQPTDNDHGESRTVRARNVVPAHATVRSDKGSENDDQGDGAEERGEELRV